MSEETVILSAKTLTEPYTYQIEGTAIICGDIKSNAEVTFKVKNLIIFGNISAPKINWDVKKDVYANSAYTNAILFSATAGETLFLGMSEKSIEKMKALNIHVHITEVGLIVGYKGLIIYYRPL